jgi:hypothetical protein
MLDEAFWGEPKPVIADAACSALTLLAACLNNLISQIMGNEQTSTNESFHKLLYTVDETLKEDVDRYLDAIEKEDSQFWRRGFVRAIFAYIEGVIYTMKLEALVIHKMIQSTLPSKKLDLPQGATFSDFTNAVTDLWKKTLRGAGFSPPELLYLVEMSVDLNDKGEVRPSWGAKISLEKNIVFAFRAYAQAYEIQYKLDKGGVGWQNFKTAIKVRDRLMHPKRIKDLTVTDDEIEFVMNANMWVIEKKVEVMKLIADNRKKQE